MNKNKIVFLVPGKSAQGGINNYYYAIKSELSLNIEYIIRGPRNAPVRGTIITEGFRFINDLLRFFYVIIHKNIKLVQISTSLMNNSLIRDSLFILLSYILRKKIIIFFHGWDLKYEKKIEKLYLKVFKSVFFKADCIIVLAHNFKQKLIEWGYQGKVFLETTFVSNDLLNGIDINILKEKHNKAIKNLLFLARVEKEKGVYEVVDTYNLLKEKYPELNLIIAGDGLELDKLKKYAFSKNIKGISFTGFIYGKDRVDILKKADIYLFPSYYPEGMPTSVLEAMAFGMPVITTKVGGLADIFHNERNGFFVDERYPQNIARKVELLIKDKSLYERISFNNYYYIQEKFIIPIVARRFESILSKMLV